MKRKFNHFTFFVSSLMAFLVFSTLLCAAGVRRTQPMSRSAAETQAASGRAEDTSERLFLQTEYDEEAKAKKSFGYYKVYENRAAKKGLMLELKILILHATDPNPEPDPVFILRGGPGVPAADFPQGVAEPWLRRKRDIVLVNQRGTGGTNKLACKLPSHDDNPQGYLDPFFNEEAFRKCVEELKKKFDLTMYSTCAAMDDLNEIRIALGYEKINLIGMSYGTRAALTYMRQHPESVRTAILNGAIPSDNLNPLFHAPSAQEAIDLLFAECAADPKCNAAFPDLNKKLRAILKRLEEKPAAAWVTHPKTKKKVQVKLSRDAFAGTLRFMLYTVQRNRQVPMLIQRAYEGDFSPFAEVGVAYNRGVRSIITFGQLLCVTCAEDLAHITTEDIRRVTAGTFLGDVRVRTQKAVCDFWPQSVLPADYAHPVKVDVPVLLLSGTQDPVTPPKWAEAAARHLPNCLHVIVAGTHGVAGDCITKITQKFLETGSVKGIDTSCTKSVKMPPFALPKKK